jgi:polysaccharide export outer membrane protein
MPFHESLERSALVLAMVAFGLVGCAGSFVWVDDLSESAGAALEESTYTIVNGDLLNIRVYNQDAISVRARVGADGKVALPLVGELEAKGARTGTLAREIEARLKPFIVAPSVAITVDEAQPLKVTVVGEVAHAAMVSVAPGTGVLQVLALAGGLTEYATHDRVFVLRQRRGRSPLRIRFTYDDLTRGVGRAPAFRVESGDTVVVE